MGIRGKPYLWVESYLMNRTQTVVINNVKSHTLPSKIGVPQGSILGPLLFIIFVSDIHTSCPTSHQIIQYADDTNILMANNDIEKLIDNCNQATREFDQYCKHNGLNLNVTKTHFIRFLPKNISPNYEPYLHLSGKSIQSSETVNFLGLIFDSKLTWNAHIDKVTSKLSTYCYIMRNIRTTVSYHILKLLYYGLTQSTLHYGLIFWGSSPYFQDAFIAQKKVIRAMFGVPYNTSCKPLFKKAAILTLPSLFVLQLILYIKQNEHTFNRNDEIHTYNTRNKTNIRQPFSRLEIGQHSPRYIGTKCFNKYRNILSKNEETFPVSVKLLKHKLQAFLTDHTFYSVEEFLQY